MKNIKGTFRTFFTPEPAHVDFKEVEHMFRLLAKPTPTGRLNVSHPDPQFYRRPREGKSLTFPLEMPFHNLESRLMDAYMREPMVLRVTNTETTVAFDIEASPRFKQELQDYWFNDLIYGHPNWRMARSSTPEVPFVAMHGNQTIRLETFKTINKEHKEWKAKLWDYVPTQAFLNHRIDVSTFSMFPKKTKGAV